MDEILLFPGRIRINKETFTKRPARASFEFYTIRIITTYKRDQNFYQEL
jgi:hypothetical protein